MNIQIKGKMVKKNMKMILHKEVDGLITDGISEHAMYISFIVRVSNISGREIHVGKMALSTLINYL